jgi:dihydrofolate synthase/folylpolyglutamate synthase
MSFAAAVEQLHALGAELASGAARRKFDLEHMRVLASALGDPQQRFPSVLIAGTNGKGSTAATLASILSAAGMRTGLYTSPHLVRVTERIQTSDPALCAAELCEIGEEEFARIYFQVDETARILVADGRLPHPPSFFEMLTAIAFLYFAERQVEIAVLEVGLGGRLDATNIVEPVLSVITDVALDHQEYLGSTIGQIAREKAGILRPNGTLVTLPQHPEANQAIGEAAVALGVRGVNAVEYLPGRELGAAPNEYDVRVGGATVRVKSPLGGEHQRRNIALAIAAAVELRANLGSAIPEHAIEQGIARTKWPGRLEWAEPHLLLDVAHNPAGAWALRAAIAALPEERPRTLLFSCLRDKDVREMARILFPLFDRTGGRAQDHIVFAPIASPRAAALEDLMAAAREMDVPAESAASVPEALELARRVTPDGGVIVVTGSIYLVGAVRELVVG